MRFLSIHTLVIFLSLSLSLIGFAQEPTGMTCEDAIPLGSEYSGTVPGAGTYWYKANSYDLPLSIHFSPADGSSSIAPTVEVDFTCTPGVYDNPQLDSILHEASGWGYAMPLKFTCDLIVVDGHNEFSLSVGKTYRDLLASLGMTDNVTAYVKVTYAGGGGIDLSPDTTFSNCMDRGTIVLLASTYHFNPGEEDVHYIFPMTKWQDDSLRLIWKGEAKATMYLSTICDFEFDASDDKNKIYDIYKLNPKDTLKITNRDIKAALDWPENNGGLYYAKISSANSGDFTIEHLPMTPPDGGAVTLQYGRKIDIAPHDTATLYAIPANWTGATQFTTPSQLSFKMYIGLEADFQTDDAIEVYQFHKAEEGRWFGITKNEMEKLWACTEANYLYVRFDCGMVTTLQPTKWYPSECVEKVQKIYKDTTINIAAQSSVVYGLYHSDWLNGDVQFKWTANSVKCPTYIADSCAFSLSETAPHVIKYNNINRRSTWTISEAEWAAMEDQKDEAGFIYVRFNPSSSANMTISSTAPEEIDPVCNPVDSTNTIVECDKFEWRGKTYTQSGKYVVSNIDAWCPDTIFTLNLTINHSTSAQEEIEAEGIYVSPLGNVYTQSGTYIEKTTNVAGCDSIITLILLISEATYEYDTIHFCEGFNYIHDELIGFTYVNYEPYIYESPAEWDYMDGVELQHDGARTLMDLHKAEENLYEHYTGSLTPITAISWSHRPEGKKTYEPITVEDEPQWIEAGSLALHLQFLCGETYSTSYVTDIDNVDADATPVKRIENGRVIILRGGVRYDMLGNVIK